MGDGFRSFFERDGLFFDGNANNAKFYCNAPWRSTGVHFVAAQRSAAMTSIANRARRVGDAA